MVKEGLGTMQLARLRYFAKRLGIPDSMRASRVILRKALGNILFDGDIVLDQERVPVNKSYWRSQSEEKTVQTVCI